MSLRTVTQTVVAAPVAQQVVRPAAAAVAAAAPQPLSSAERAAQMRAHRLAKVGQFSWSETDEPHATRRKLILSAHPEIVELFGTEPLTFWIALAIQLFQLGMAWSLRTSSWYVLLPLAYVIGGTLNHALQLAVHELSHDLCWSGKYKDAANRLSAIMANLVTGFPSGQTFKPYHMDHHQFQGVDGVDVDIPHAIELNLVTNTLSKLLWVLLQPVCYALRPMLIKPKPVRFWEGLNWTVQMAFNAAIVYFMGARSFLYLITGTLLGMGMHPAAGHFIAEHYEFVTGTETYSYYGSANWFNFNVGYHNEHHDFPKVPWSRLPLVKQMAPEFYDHLPCYHSYITEVFWPYITDPTLGVWSRVKRRTTAEKYAALDKSTDKRAISPMKVLAFGGMAGMVMYMIGFFIFGFASSQ